MCPEELFQDKRIGGSFRGFQRQQPRHEHLCDSAGAADGFSAALAGQAYLRKAGAEPEGRRKQESQSRTAYALTAGTAAVHFHAVPLCDSLPRVFFALRGG